MRVISNSALKEFWSVHPEAEGKMSAWYSAIKHCTKENFNELKQSFPSADYVPEKYTVFDVGGNAYRIVTVIHYDKQMVYIRGVYTHTEYDRWTKRNR